MEILDSIKGFFSRYGITGFLFLISPLYTALLIDLMFLAYFLDKGIFSYDFFNHGIGVSAGTFVFLPVGIIILLGIIFGAAIPIYFYGLRQVKNKNNKLTRTQNRNTSLVILVLNLFALFSFIVIGLKDDLFVNLPHVLTLTVIPLLLILNLTTPAIRDTCGRTGINTSYAIHAAYYSLPILIMLNFSTVSGLMSGSLQIFNVGGMVPVKLIKQPEHDEDAMFEKWGKLIFRSPNTAFVQETSENGDFIVLYQLHGNVFLQRTRIEKQD